MNPQDFHITLHFFGSISQEKLILISKQLEQITNQKEFTLEIGQLSTFGQPLKPRVLWLGVAYQTALTSLHQSVQHIVGQFTVADKRKFIPHITLGKKWASNNQLNRETINMNTEKKVIQINKIAIYEIHPEETQKKHIRI